MSILRERKAWRRERPTRSQPWGFSLTDAEREHVKRALRLLCLRHGGIESVAKALGVSFHMVDRATSRRSRPSPGLAIAVARLAEMPVESLLRGEPVPGPCPTCGRA
jgi:transcriptional regulator with XRE-family HTH domain